MRHTKTLPAVVLAMSALAIAMIAGLEARSDSARRAQADLGRVGEALSERTTVPIGVLFGAPHELVQLQMAKLQADAQSTVDTLRSEEPVPSLARVQHALDRNLAAGNATLLMMRGMTTDRGRAAIATALTGNDPELDRVLAELRASATEAAGALDVARGETLAAADERPAMLALFDLNGFKQYDDSFGHQAGDALLHHLGERLAERLEGRATAYRMGGDEFCVLAHLDGEDAPAIARLGAEALTEQGEALSIGCSYGIALAPHEATTAGEVLGLADQRMYEQKASGAPAARQAAIALT